MVNSFTLAVENLEQRFARDLDQLADDNVETELRKWLGEDGDMPWERRDCVTPDEWFFITTLYGQMTLDGQRTHIRKHFTPLFVEAAGRGIHNFVPNMPQYAGLRAPWMKQRLCRMAAVLQEKHATMSDYVGCLQRLEKQAEPADPQPALDRIKLDLQAGEAKTASVFVRDCVKGNCFPIDSRVKKELARWGLPSEERQLVTLSLAIGRNPRVVARMFYNAGGEQ